MKSPRDAEASRRGSMELVPPCSHVHATDQGWGTTKGVEGL